MYKVYTVSAILPWCKRSNRTLAFAMAALCFLNKNQFYKKLLEICCTKLTNFKFYLNKYIF